MATELKNLVAKSPSRLGKQLIRRLRATEIGSVMEILQESDTAAAWSAKNVEEMLASAGILALASERKGTVTGFLFARQVADEAELLNIAVRRDFRRKGEGSALLSAAIGELSTNRVRRIFLEVRQSNHGAIAFYQKHGFSDSGRRKSYYRDPIEDALCMDKKLIA